MKKTILFFVTLISLAISSCSNNKLSNKIQITCNNKPNYELKSCKEPNGNFEINLPKNWKREFFVSESESRLYFADTTKELSETFITDIGYYKVSKKIDAEFFEQKLQTLNKEENNSIGKEINFQDKKGYIFKIHSDAQNFDKNSIEIYLQNKNDSYFMISIDAYGNENIDERFCEALQLIENSYFY